MEKTKMDYKRELRHYKSKARKLDQQRKALLILVVFILFLLGMQTVDKNIKLQTASDCAPVTQAVFYGGYKTYAEEFEVVVPVDSPAQSWNALPMPETVCGDFKTYMDYRKITNKSSKQWELQQVAVTNDNGFRVIDDKPLVAVGTCYAKEAGKLLRITLDSGKQFEVIVGDIKQDRHTDANNQFVEFNGNMIEFIVDTKKVDPLLIKLGDVSKAGLSGAIVLIEEEE